VRHVQHARQVYIQVGKLQSALIVQLGNIQRRHQVAALVVLWDHFKQVLVTVHAQPVCRARIAPQLDSLRLSRALRGVFAQVARLSRGHVLRVRIQSLMPRLAPNVPQEHFKSAPPPRPALDAPSACFNRSLANRRAAPAVPVFTLDPTPRAAAAVVPIRIHRDQVQAHAPTVGTACMRR
jgi:hypothetical protein